MLGCFLVSVSTILQTVGMRKNYYFFKCFVNFFKKKSAQFTSTSTSSGDEEKKNIVFCLGVGPQAP